MAVGHLLLKVKLGGGLVFFAFAGGTFLFFSPRLHNASYYFSCKRFVLRNVCA